MRTDFHPATHGFAFANNFTNKVSIAGIPITETRGRCGGMAFAALDLWHNRLSVPTNTTVPADGTLVADYLYWRLIDSIRDNWPMYFHFMRTPDHPTVINGIGVARATREEQLPRLKAALDSGVPQPLGLTQAVALDQFGNDHQVVAYGYEEQGPETCIFIWDNNDPFLECTLRFKTAYDPSDRAVRHSNGSVWRGWFVSAYAPQVPAFLQRGRLLKEQSDAKIYVVHGGAKAWIPNPAEFEASGHRWNEVQTVADDSLRHVADVPGDRTVIRAFNDPKVYVVYGGAKFWITDPAALAELGFSWNDVAVAPSGSLDGVGTIPADGTLLSQIGDPKVYVIEGGQRRWIPDPATFTGLGHSWDRVGRVAAGQLDHLPEGPAIPQLGPPLTWAQKPSGQLLSPAGDAIDYRVEAGVLADPNAVEFVLEQGPAFTWRKELVLHANDGTWTIAIGGSTSSDRNGLYRQQLPNGRLEFRKQQLFGNMSHVMEVRELDTIPNGARITFNWVRA